MTKYCKTIMEYMDCPCELFENEKDYSVIYKRYSQLYEEGKENGFTPLIISVDDLTAENFDDSGVKLNISKIKSQRVSDIEKAGKLDLSDVLPEYKPEYESDFGEFDAEYSGSINKFECISNFNGGLVKEIIIARIPTDKPWELAVYAPMGGFNECPVPEEQAAVFKHWYEKYGAVPAAVSYDVWELYVQNPVSDRKTAMELAYEMCCFCSDIVEQGVGTIGALAGSIVDSHIWYFWWD